MPLKYLIDEHLLGDFAKSLIIAGVSQGVALDVLEIGNDIAPVLGTKDPELLLWCEAQDRILISRDVTTMPDHLAAHIAIGHHSPGIFMIRPNRSWMEVLEDLVGLAEASLPDEWRDQILFIPL